MPLSKKVGFRGGHGDWPAARLDMSVTKPVAYALFAHCFTCSKDALAASRIGRELTGTNFSSNVARL